jgi:peptidoglycan/LPS O-acetylase OafA/YrhL
MSDNAGVTAAISSRTPAGRGTRMPYLGGLDGLRAIAVMAVLLYHGELSWIPGGFLGVEIFFVISGYLITALLLAEHRDTGRIDLKGFWIRRARRLLPALFLLLVVTVAVAVVFLPDEVASLRGDVVAAFAYVSNWGFIFAEKSYFEAVGRPSLVQHLWSLAVEEQFYLVWPLLFAGGMRFLGRRRLPVAVLAVALASATLMWVLYTPGSDPSRVYYGTDTRASGIFLGCLLAFVWAPWRLKPLVSQGARWLLDGVGVVALLLLLQVILVTDEFSDSLYRGGFLRVDLITLVVIAVVAHPAARLGTLLGMGPLRWVGLRSYGIYLWHWPVYMLTRPDVDVPLSGWPLLALRLALTFGLAELSYRYVEQPIRRGALVGLRGRARQAWAQLDDDTRLRWAGASLAGVVLVGLVGVAVVRADQPPPVDFAAIGAGELATEPIGAPGATVPGPDGSVVPPPPPPPAPTGPPPTGIAAALPVSGVGDSVMLGAGTQLAALGVSVDAAIARQVDDGIEILAAQRDAGVLGNSVVVHLGNNGTFSDEQFDEIMAIVGDRKVVFVTILYPRRWQDPNNEVIRNGAARYPNVVVADWAGAASADRSLLYEDGAHPNPAGAERYAQLVAEAYCPC